MPNIRLYEKRHGGVNGTEFIDVTRDERDTAFVITVDESGGVEEQTIYLTRKRARKLRKFLKANGA